MFIAKIAQTNSARFLSHAPRATRHAPRATRQALLSSILLKSDIKTSFKRLLARQKAYRWR
jgi:hypothetical protein